MAPVKFQRVVSFSSEDPNQPAENLVKDGAYRKWRCKLAGEPKAWIELQLEKMSVISAVDIGNHGSAFIEILVGRSGCSEEDYKVLLNSASFMTPQECRNETNLQRVRIFKYQDLNKAAQTEKWDRIRVVCTQPFNKQLQYGLSFITIHAPEEEAPKTQSSNGATTSNINLLGAFKLREEPTFDPVKQSVFFSRFQSPRTSSLTTQPGPIRAASQSLAAIALAQSEQEAMSILRKTPTKKDGRPEIKLTEKLKESKSQSPTASKTAYAKAQEQSPLPSRKEVESDRPKPPVTPTTPIAARTPIRKKEERKVKPTTPNEVKREVPVKRKTPPPSQPDDTHHVAKKPKLTRPFNRLLEGDVVVLSGFQNPLRSQLRDKLLALGAVYKPDWNASCTHLICAFYNTPKFREVRGKGKIVTKNWVEDCYAKRKRFPWRRYCLDRNDKKEESEEEIWAGEDQVASSPVTTKPGAGSSARSSSSNKTASSDTISKSSLVEDEDDYGGSTEVDEVDTDDEIDKIKKKIIEEQALANQSPPLDFFSGSNFFLGKDLSDDTKEELKNCIQNFQGQIIPKLRSKVTHFITDNPDDASLTKAQSKNEKMKIIKTDWIRKCQKLQKYISPDEFAIALSTSNE